MPQPKGFICLFDPLQIVVLLCEAGLSVTRIRAYRNVPSSVKDSPEFEELPMMSR